MDDRVARFRELWADEKAGAALYRALAENAEADKRAILLKPVTYGIGTAIGVTIS